MKTWTFRKSDFAEPTWEVNWWADLLEYLELPADTNDLEVDLRVVEAS